MSFPAQYRGECDICDEPINVGDLITKNEVGCYVHDACPHPINTETKFKGTTLDDMGY